MYNTMHQSVICLYSSCKDGGIYFETRALQSLVKLILMLTVNIVT